ncbi:MAG: JAB domain-containing protein [Brevundimonas aurantiaca]|jgi:DNA repair protein RadC|uniref:JAB domain-containing protein n=1 Tax=Brevundimonas aurantiaca TaxID=74316 RepID=UPI0040338E45
MTKTAQARGVAEPMLPFIEGTAISPFDPNPLGRLNDEDLLDVYLDDPNQARLLIEAFGSIAAITAAEPAEIVRRTHASPETVRALKVAREMTLRITKADLRKRSPVTSFTELLAHLRVQYGHSIVEQFVVLFLDNRNHLITDHVFSVGTVDHTFVYPREVIRRALELAAKSIVICHNHPSGASDPSKADIELTKEIVAAAKIFGIAVHDHVIITRGQHYSFKSNGLI